MSISHPWYKRYPLDFIHGTMGLSLEEKGAYSLILDLIYDKGGAIVDDARYLAGICNISLRKWANLRQRLIETHKIIIEDGFIFNFRAQKEIEALIKLDQKQRESGAKGGRKRAQNVANANIIKTLEESPLNHPLKHIYVIEEEEEEEEDKEEETSLSYFHSHAVTPFSKKDKARTVSKKNNQSISPIDCIQEPLNSNNCNKYTSKEENTLQLTSRKAKQQAFPDENAQTPAVKDTKPTPAARGSRLASSTRGSRLPADFAPDFTLALQEGFTEVQAQRLFENFKDYWNAKTGKDATKRD